MTLVLTVILVALIFEYINGFHDTANSIATVVSTKVLTPRQAILLAATTNLVGALAGHAVAKTVSSGLVDGAFVTNYTIVCALLGGITWNLITWWFGLPSSSTHALVGGLCGATLATAHGNWKAILWSVEKVGKDGVVKHEGILHKVVIPMFTSPIIGLVGGFIIMSLLYLVLKKAKPGWVNRVFGKLQLASAGYMGFAHGLADAQKTMGIITLALVTATSAGVFTGLSPHLSFLRMDKSPEAEQALRVLATGNADSDARIKATETLQAEASKLKNPEFREAFFAMTSVAHAKLGNAEAATAARTASAAAHAEIQKSDASELMPRLPLIGNWFKAKRTDWLDSLNKEVVASEKSGKDPLSSAASMTRSLSPEVPAWIKIVCALTMAAGTAAGGWKIIKTMGHKMVKLQPVHGFAAETTAATLLAVTGGLGMTVSTTHAITTSIMGVGAAKRWSALKLNVVERILWAWVLTLPAAGGVAYGLMRATQWLGWTE